MNEQALILWMQDNGWICDINTEDRLGFVHKDNNKDVEWIRDYNKKTWSYTQFNGKQIVNLRVTKMKYPKPFGEKILIRRKKSAQQIIITSEVENEGEIVAVGDGTEKHSMRLSVGQNVMFRGYGMRQIPIAEDKDNAYLLCEQDDVLMIMD